MKISDHVVKQIAADMLNINTDDFGIYADFFDLGADSLDVLNIMVELESHYEVSVDNDEACCCVNDIIEALKKAMEAKNDG